MGCMSDLSTVRGHIPDIQKNGVEVMLLNIHESPARELLERFGFVATPTYLIFDGDGTEIFRSNSLPSVDDIITTASA